MRVDRYAAVRGVRAAHLEAAQGEAEVPLVQRENRNTAPRLPPVHVDPLEAPSETGTSG